MGLSAIDLNDGLQMMFSAKPNDIWCKWRTI